LPRRLGNLIFSSRSQRRQSSSAYWMHPNDFLA
jgi:hypothetical protein